MLPTEPHFCAPTALRVDLVYALTSLLSVVTYTHHVHTQTLHTPHTHHTHMVYTLYTPHTHHLHTIYTHTHTTHTPCIHNIYTHRHTTHTHTQRREGSLRVGSNAHLMHWCSLHAKSSPWTKWCRQGTGEWTNERTNGWVNGRHPSPAGGTWGLQPRAPRSDSGLRDQQCKAVGPLSPPPQPWLQVTASAALTHVQNGSTCPGGCR